MLRARDTDTVEAVLEHTLKGGPEIQMDCHDGRWRLTRWRQFVGSYELPELPGPIFCVDIAKAGRARVWEVDGWSGATSYQGAVSIVPAERATRWLIDGELDVVILSMASDDLREASVIDQFQRTRFAYADTFGSTLVRQIVSAFYSARSDSRTAYIAALVEALKAHMLRGPISVSSQEFPQCDASSYVVHRIIAAIKAEPEGDHSLEELASVNKLTPSYLCRVFKKSTGLSPHQFVLNTRIERACELLTHSNSSMAAIATLTGFGSQSHFTRAFRNIVGEPPSTFRRRGGDVAVKSNHQRQKAVTRVP